MAYGMAPEEVPHVRHEVRMDQDRRLQGRLQRDARPGRPHPGRRTWPRGRCCRSQTGDVGVPRLRVQAHLQTVAGGEGQDEAHWRFCPLRIAPTNSFRSYSVRTASLPPARAPASSEDTDVSLRALATRAGANRRCESSPMRSSALLTHLHQSHSL